MPDTTLQTGDDPDRLTPDLPKVLTDRAVQSTGGEPGVEPGLAGRMTAALDQITTLIDDLDDGADDPGAMRDAAVQCASAALRRFPYNAPQAQRPAHADTVPDDTRDLVALDMLVEGVEGILATISRHTDGLAIDARDKLYGPVYGAEAVVGVLRERLGHMWSIACMRSDTARPDGLSAMDLLGYVERFRSNVPVRVHAPDGGQYRIARLDSARTTGDDALVVHLATEAGDQ